MKDTVSAARGNFRQRQRRWIVFICALLGAGTGFVLSFHPFAVDAFAYHDVSRVYEDEKGTIHVEPYEAASISVFNVKVFSEETLDWDWVLIDRWRRYCQLIAGGFIVVGFVVGAGLGLCIQRLTQRWTPKSIDIQLLQGENSVSARPPSV
jgi:hypothetical protein